LRHEGAADRLEALVALAQYQLGFVETIQLDTALTRTLAALPSGASLAAMPRIRLGVLASSTVDHLLAAIRVAGLRRRLLIDMYVGAFGQYRQELLEAASGLRRFAPDMILFSLGWRDFVGSVPLAASIDVAHEAVAHALAELRTLWRQARDRLRAVAIQQSFLDVTEPLFGSYELSVPGSPASLVSRLNAQLAEAVAGEGALLLDIARASARDGLTAWFDVARWLQAKIEIAPQASSLYGELLARLIAAQRGQSRKCLVLDLDNTLWGGVIGEVGLEGIVLGEGSAAGEAYLALQRYAKSLAERGVILAVCSKNEPAIVEDAFRDHPEMLLRRSDIAAFVVNWQDKAENLRTIAEQLNIGLDSLVFVDDNPAERARIRESLPTVAVPELPQDPAHYVHCIAAAGYFEAIAFTDEDRRRVEQYAANSQREALRETMQSMDDFLRGLDMAVEYGPVGAVDVPRVTQLLNKTNQFNTTTRRFTTEEISAFASDPGKIALQFRLLDRFGDNGMVSVMLLSARKDDPEVLEVVNWVMSCRVFGRQLEDEAMNIAVEAARTRGKSLLHADLIATKKNAVIRGLFADLGFAPLPEPAAADTTRWRLDLHTYAPRPTFIQRRAPA
jgi:FkbH-like protein